MQKLISLPSPFSGAYYSLVLLIVRIELPFHEGSLSFCVCVCGLLVASTIAVVKKKSLNVFTVAMSKGNSWIDCR